MEVSPVAQLASTFNLGLIVGNSSIISTTTRTKTYSGTDDMKNGGWAGTEPEYKAATAYFSQTPRPTNVVIGRQGTVQTELTAALTSGTAYTTLSVQALTEDIASGTTLTIGSGGTTQTVTTSADAPVNAVSISVTSFTANAAYAINTPVSANETILEAVTACRSSNTNWYACYVCGGADADIEAVAQYIESATPTSVYFYDTQDTAILAGTTPNLMSTLQGDAYTRTMGIYSTTAYAGAAVMGVAMGSNTGLANSAFTMAYKTLVGVTPEVLTTTEYTNIKGWNGNTYTSFGGQYNLLTPGYVANGTPFDQILNLDILTANIQTAAITALTSEPKIPQTDGGVTMIMNDIAATLDEARTEGILAPGVWNAAPVLGLQTGTNLPMGYLVLADTIANQSQTDRDARKSPPIYACVKLAGAIEHAVIGLVVNQ